MNFQFKKQKYFKVTVIIREVLKYGLTETLGPFHVEFNNREHFFDVFFYINGIALLIFRTE